MSRRIVLLVASCFLWQGPRAVSQIQWTWLNPSVPTLTYAGVACIDSSTIIVVGAAGTILRSTDSGESWKTTNTSTLYGLSSVSFSDSRHGAAVGSSGTILLTTNGGIDWTLRASGTTLLLRSVAFADSLNGLIVGGSLFEGVILRTTDGGVSWAKTTGRAPGDQINAVSFTSPGVALLVTQTGLVYRSTDGGNSWQILVMNERGQPLFAISCLRNGHAVAAGYGVMCTADSGNTWKLQTLNAGLPRSGVCITNSGFGFVVGSGVRAGLVQRTTDFGATWTDSPLALDRTFASVSIWGTNIAFIVGEAGIIVRTTDGGTTWKNLQINLTSQNFTCVNAFDSDSAVALGMGGGILRTNDGGKTWKSCVSGTSKAIRSVSFWGKRLGTAVGDGGTILQTLDAGQSWYAQSSNTTATLVDVCRTSDRRAYAVGSGGTIICTTDSGTTWLPQSSGITDFLNAVSFFDDSHGIAVGGNGPLGGGAIVLRTTNGGAVWTRAPGSPGVVHVLVDVVFVDSNTVVAVGYYNATMYSSDILRSSDGGYSWQFVAGFSFSQTFERLSFPDHTTGYAVATGGVLSTSDGGRSWTKSLDGIGQSPHAISFYDAQNGLLVGSGGLIIRASNGSITNIDAPRLSLPKEFVLYQNYPNPFNPSTAVSFQVSAISHVTLRLFDIVGREVATLVNETLSAGSYKTTWNASPYPSGIYFYRLQSGDCVETKKMILLR
ncbi:MAG: YCF48-related protein [Ignavibacteriales bacterium]|nr:YCF48-related protein [Ignavibacteriales bacterium]